MAIPVATSPVTNPSHSSLHQQAYGLVENVLAHGAKGDGVTDDTAAIQATINAVDSAGGGIVFLPPGTYIITSGLTGTGATLLAGAGRGTVIQSANNIDLITISAASTAGLQDLTVKRTGTISSGALVVLSSGSRHTLTRCVLGPSYDAVKVVNAYGWTMTDCIIADDGHYGLHQRSVTVPDRGDNNIKGCTFDTSTGGSAAIFHESGGGLYVSSTKFLHHTRAYDLQVEDGAATANTLFSGCSFENPVTAWVRLGRGGTTGTYDAVAFSGCQFRAIAGMTGGVTVGAGITDFNLSGSILRGLTSFIGVDITGGNDHYVGNNVFNAFSQAVKVTGGARTRVGVNHYNGVTGLIVEGVPFDWTGTGAPTYGATSGSVFWRTDGGAGTTLYVREAAAWTAK